MFDDLKGYACPITITVDDICDSIIKRTDEAIMAEVRGVLNIDIDKEALIKAIQYDRGQFKEGFNAGYFDGYAAGLERAYVAIKKILINERGGTDGTED